MPVAWAAAGAGLGQALYGQGMRCILATNAARQEKRKYETGTNGLRDTLQGIEVKLKQGNVVPSLTSFMCPFKYKSSSYKETTFR